MTDDEALFDSFAPAYDRWFEERGKLIFEIELRAFRDVLPSLPRPWLEVGVGSGRFAQALGIEAGVDPSASLLEMAARRGIATRRGKGEDRIFPAGSFGAVFFIVSLCFVDSVGAALSEAYRILRPDGRLVLGLVLRESPWGQHYLQEKERGHPCYKHAHLHTHAEIEAFLGHTGFAIEKVLSTLFQGPEQVRGPEIPQAGYSPEAGFTIIVAQKSTGTDG